MKLKFNFDTLSYAVGLITSLLIFISQGPYDSYWKYLLPFTPLGIVFIVLTFKQIIILIYNSRTKYLLEELKFIKSTKTVANWILRAENTKGDLNVTKIHRITLLTNDVIKKTTGEIIYSINNLKDLPPEAKVEESNTSGRKLTSHSAGHSIEKIDGIKNNRYKWRYTIDPPLSKKGDFVEYLYEYKMPSEIRDAFTDNGDIISLEQKSFWQDTMLTLVAPTSYRIVILESYIEDYNGDKQEIESSNNKPKLKTNNTIMEWTTEYKHFSRYICKYKLIEK